MYEPVYNINKHPCKRQTVIGEELDTKVLKAGSMGGTTHLHPGGKV